MKKLRIFVGAFVLVVICLVAVELSLAQGDTFTIICNATDGAGNPLSVPELGVFYDSGAFLYPPDASCSNCDSFSMTVPVSAGDAGCLVWLPLDSDLQYQDASGSPQQDAIVTSHSYDPYGAEDGDVKIILWDVSLPATAGSTWEGTFIYQQPEPDSLWITGEGGGAFNATEMDNFFADDPVSEGGSDFIPNSGEWLTNITDYALSWLQTINQDDFLFFLMAFGLVNYIISWLWRQLSGASVMGEAQAWRGMFDDGEE
jgi:hypothetical protein